MGEVSLVRSSERRNSPISLPVLGIGYATLVSILVALVSYFDGASSHRMASLAWLLGGGVVGAWLAWLLTLDRVELGIVPLAALWLGAVLVALNWSDHLSDWDPFGLPGRAASPIALGLLGIGTGMFLSPLVSIVWMRGGRERSGERVAALVMSAVGAMLAAGLFFYLVRHVGLLPGNVYLIAGIATLLVTAYCCWLLPEFMFRFLFWVLTHTIYRIRVVGRENLPDHGPGLLVCNHVSYVDGFFLVASTHRLIRFVVWGGIANSPYLRWLSRIMGVIPIAAADGPKALARSLRAARDALRAGQLVCVFAEGQISRTGTMLKFKRGFERVLQGVEAPIIPTFLDCVWGSIFSFQGGRVFWKWPKVLPYPVTVSFGKPLPPNTDVFKVRMAVQQLGSKSAATRKSRQRPVHREFIRQAARRPFRFCMADSRGTELTFGKALAGVVALDRVLRRRLRSDEEMVGVLLPPSVGGSLVNFALLSAGKIPINLNYTASSEVIASCVRQCGIQTIITSPEVLKRVKITLPFQPTHIEDIRRDVTRWDKCIGMLGGFVLPGWMTERWLMGLRQQGMDDVATVIFSSGSTGDPKGVKLSHHNVISNCEAVIQVLDPTCHDRVIGVLPLFHSFGFLANLIVPFMVGAGAVYHSNPLDSKEVGELSHKYGGTILLATPTFLRSYARKIPSEHFKTLRLILAGAEKLPAEVASAFREKFGVEPMEGYGCTELSPVVSVNTRDFHCADGRQIGNKPGTVGHPIPGVAAKVVDPDTFEELPVGQNGLLLITGPNVMLGYLGKPDLTAQVIKDGWYVTGDIANLDDDGFITITDRLTRFSKIAGEMVPHIRVEEAIRGVLGTEDQGAVVTGVPDPSRGERLVVIHPPLPIAVETLWQKLNGSELPKLWIPGRDSFFEVSELPYLGTGKLDLQRIKALAREHAK
jgi:acyl-[acyl-carrier-protein]-phospholipid O-acyltransferase/long-chain-fatty-acid--[acyl-carrier-protein] ligase